MSATDPSVAIREITEAAQAYCEGLFPGPYKRIGSCVTGECDGLTTLQLPSPEIARQVCTALNHAPAGWKEILERIVKSLDALYDGIGWPEELDRAMGDALEAVDRALALQRGEG